MPHVLYSGSSEHYNLIERVQNAKRDYGDESKMNATKSDRYVLSNPVTGRTPSERDLKYALAHLSEIYSSGKIREDRWAFLWYH